MSRVRSESPIRLPAAPLLDIGAPAATSPPAGEAATEKQLPPGSDLAHRIGVDVLQRLQDRFAQLGRVTVCICDIEGRPITRPTWGSRFSELIGTAPGGAAAFTESICHCAADPLAQVPSICHEDLSLYATPILHQGRRLGTIIVGSRPAAPPEEKTVRALARRYQIDEGELARAASETVYDRGLSEAIYRFADVLAETVATLYAQAEQIQRQLADLATVHAISELLAGTKDLQEILDRTVQRVVEVMQVKACAIRLLDESTGELRIQAVANLSQEYLDKGPVMLAGSAIDAAAFNGEAVYIENAATDPRMRYPENARREGIVSGLCVPLTYRGPTIGVIRVYTGRPYRFNSAEVALLRSIGSSAAAAIIHARLRDDQVEAERFQNQMKAAAAIQQRMLPPCAPQHRRLQFGCVYNPTLHVGGDFYDFIRLKEGRGAIGVCDVVGKGLPAALLMSSVRATLRAYATQIAKVNHVVARVNRQMYRDTLPGEFATLVFGVFSPDGRELTYCNAGHLPPLLVRDGGMIKLETGGMVVGVQPTASYECETLRLQEGDLLVMVTDGVTEAMNFRSTAYGMDRLRESILRHQSLDAPQLAAQLLWDVRRFVGLAEQSDDITIVVARIT